MQKVTIQEDAKGPYIEVGGWYARPCDEPHPLGYYAEGTTFKAGDTTEALHFEGSSNVGVKKIEGRGNYQERWQTTDLIGNCLGMLSTNNIVDEPKVKPKRFIFW